MNAGIAYIPSASADLYYRLVKFYSLSTINSSLNIKNCIVFFNSLIINFHIYTIIYITRNYVMNQTNTHNNNIIYADSKMPGRLSLVENIHRACPHSVCGHAPQHGACPHKNILLHFADFFFSGANYTLVTCIR